MKLPVSLSLRHKGKVLELDASREIVNLLGNNGEAIGSLSWDFVIDQILAYRKPAIPKETRSEPRVNLAFRVRYKTPEGDRYDSRAGGIGGGGLFIESTTPLPVGTKLAIGRFLPEVERFRPELEAAGVELVTADVSERLEEGQLLPLVGDVDGVICGDDRFTERVLAAAPRLKVLSKWGTGIDSIDQEACSRRGVRVCRTLDAFSGPVAESVLGYALVFARGLLRMDRGMKRGLWSKERATTLAESCFGIVGVGHVGKAVARRVRALGPRLVGNDLVAMPDEFLAETGIRMLGLEELLEQSEFVDRLASSVDRSFAVRIALWFARY